MVQIIKRLLFSFLVVGSVIMCVYSFLNEYWLSGVLWFINSWLWHYDALENEHGE